MDRCDSRSSRSFSMIRSFARERYVSQVLAVTPYSVFRYRLMSLFRIPRAKSVSVTSIRLSSSSDGVWPGLPFGAPSVAPASLPLLFLAGATSSAHHRICTTASQIAPIGLGGAYHRIVDSQRLEQQTGNCGTSGISCPFLGTGWRLVTGRSGWPSSRERPRNACQRW